MTPVGRGQLILTVDVEDWAQSTWDHSLPIGARCADQALQLLEVLAEFPAARATFFVLGRFAERHASVVERIAEAGHEVASHGYEHLEVFDMEPEEFEQDLRKSTDAIAAATGKQPLGYRAADFSIVAESLWALAILASSGYRYDSSIVPVDGARYGIASWPTKPVLARLGDATIIEVPIGTMAFARKRWPLGGGYARLLPRRLLLSVLAAGSATGAPPLFYCHPYELDAGELASSNMALPFTVRLHQGLGRRRTEGKLRAVLERFECVSVTEALTASVPAFDAAPLAVERHDPRPPAFRRSPVASRRTAIVR